MATFARNGISTVEREPPVRSERAVKVGCLGVGALLGVIGYFGTHDPDSPGLEKTVGALSLAVGGVVGAVGGLLGAVVQNKDWEAWVLPDSLPSTGRLAERCI